LSPGHDEHAHQLGYLGITRHEPVERGLDLRIVPRRGDGCLSEGGFPQPSGLCALARFVGDCSVPERFDQTASDFAHNIDVCVSERRKHLTPLAARSGGQFSAEICCSLECAPEGGLGSGC
jgi:hypothetical protein